MLAFLAVNSHCIWRKVLKIRLRKMDKEILVHYQFYWVKFESVKHRSSSVLTYN